MIFVGQKTIWQPKWLCGSCGRHPASLLPGGWVNIYGDLVGGWATQLKNMFVKMGIFPRGENTKDLKPLFYLVIETTT